MVAALSLLTTFGMGWKLGRRAAAQAETLAAAPRNPDPLALAAHELRTPLGGLIAVLDALQHEAATPRQRRLVELGQMAGAHLHRLLGDVLSSTAPPHAGASTEAFDLHTLCRDTQGFWNESARGKGLRLELTLDPDVPVRVWGDPLRLRQVLFNLLANAIKFTATGGVSLRVRRQRADTAIMRFTVEDTGIGIPAGEQAQLFQPFRQGLAASQGGYGGSGLGLAISRGLVHAMGGRIALHSQPGVGTSVTVDLVLRPIEGAWDARTSPGPDGGRRHEARRHDDAPLGRSSALLNRDDREASMDGPHAKPSSDRAHELRLGRLVLLAEDNPITRELMGLQLTQLGYAWDSASDGLEALRMLRSRQYGLLLTDMRMSGMDGPALARHIRRAGLHDVHGRPLPIVALSAEPPARAASATRRAGIDAWLTKPVPQAALAACLRRWLPPVQA